MTFLSMPLPSETIWKICQWFSGLSRIQIPAGYFLFIYFLYNSWHLAKEVINRSLVRDIGPLYQLWVHMYVSATGLSAQAHQCLLCRASTQLGFPSWNLQFREIGLCLYINLYGCENTVGLFCLLFEVVKGALLRHCWKSDDSPGVMDPICLRPLDPAICAGIFKQSMGARNRVGTGLSYRPARLHRLAEFIP
jgi:hypothetical protein